MRLIIFTFLLAFLCSCSKNLTPFNQRLYEKYKWTNEDLKALQFYISEDIVLRKKTEFTEAQIKDGVLEINKEKSGELIKIKAGTPGVFLFSPKSNRFAISFNDDGDQNKYLMFGPNEKLDGNFAILAKDWQKNMGTVTYNNELYNLSAKDAYCTLMVDIKRASNVNFEAKTEKGRRIK
jgi:hypothetical protein